MTVAIDLTREQKERKLILLRELDARKKERVEKNTVYGIYSKDGKLLRCLKDTTGRRDYREVKEEPQIKVMEKMEPFLTKKKRYKIIVGGRGSGKSETVGGILASQGKDYSQKTCCFREYQNSIDDSVYALLAAKIRNLNIPNYNILSNSILNETGTEFKFKGLSRNPDGIKSMYGFKRFWGEEAQTTSSDSLVMLKPTLREEDSEIILTLNPMSSADPVSVEFLEPFMKELLKNGYYEDDMHLIIWMNYCDNPWFPDVLEKERLRDKKNKSLAEYRHIWHGDYNDSIENSLIQKEWFEACIDAHKKLGFKALGAVYAAHDPSDTGPDDKGLAIRQGSVVFSVKSKSDGDVNEGCDWATGEAIKQSIDKYTWDCDGLGVSLARQTHLAFEGKGISVSMFKGSERPDFPDSIYESRESGDIKGKKTNKDVFKNKRAQYYTKLRDRIYNTYQAVVNGEYKDPDQMISFSSDIDEIGALQSELCRMPVKPNGNGLIELYTKQEMKTRFKLPSPNLADSVMMLMRDADVTIRKPYIPRPMAQMGR